MPGASGFRSATPTTLQELVIPVERHQGLQDGHALPACSHQGQIIGRFAGTHGELRGKALSSLPTSADWRKLLKGPCQSK